MLEKLLQGLIEWTYGLVLEGWEFFASFLLNVMSLDYAYLREHIPVIDTIYRILLGVGWALLLGNLVFQALRSMLAGMGFDAEEPKLLFLRSSVFSFLLAASPQICKLCLTVTSTTVDLLSMPDAVDITFADEASFAGLNSAWIYVVICGIIVMFQSFKLILAMAERYVILSVLTVCSPLAFGMGGSRSTSDIFTGWCRTYGSMCLMTALNVVFLKLLLSVLSFYPSGLDVLPWMILVITIVKVARKADTIVARIGLNPVPVGDSLGRNLPGMLAYTVARGAVSRVIGTIGRNGGASHGSAGRGKPGGSPIPPKGGGSESVRTSASGTHTSSFTSGVQAGTAQETLRQSDSHTQANSPISMQKDTAAGKDLHMGKSSTRSGRQAASAWQRPGGNQSKGYAQNGTNAREALRGIPIHPDDHEIDAMDRPLSAQQEAVSKGAHTAASAQSVQAHAPGTAPGTSVTNRQQESNRQKSESSQRSSHVHGETAMRDKAPVSAGSGAIPTPPVASMPVTPSAVPREPGQAGTQAKTPAAPSPTRQSHAAQAGTIQHPASTPVAPKEPAAAGMQTQPTSAPSPAWQNHATQAGTVQHPNAIPVSQRESASTGTQTQATSAPSPARQSHAAQAGTIQHSAPASPKEPTAAGMQDQPTSAPSPVRQSHAAQAGTIQHPAPTPTPASPKETAAAGTQAQPTSAPSPARQSHAAQAGTIQHPAPTPASPKETAAAGTQAQPTSAPSPARQSYAAQAGMASHPTSTPVLPKEPAPAGMQTQHTSAPSPARQSHAAQAGTIQHSTSTPASPKEPSAAGMQAQPTSASSPARQSHVAQAGVAQHTASATVVQKESTPAGMQARPTSAPSPARQTQQTMFGVSHEAQSSVKADTATHSSRQTLTQTRQGPLPGAQSPSQGDGNVPRANGEIAAASTAGSRPPSAAGKPAPTAAAPNIDTQPSRQSRNSPASASAELTKKSVSPAAQEQSGSIRQSAPSNAPMPKPAQQEPHPSPQAAPRPGTMAAAPKPTPAGNTVPKVEPTGVPAPAVEAARGQKPFVPLTGRSPESFPSHLDLREEPTRTSNRPEQPEAIPDGTE